MTETSNNRFERLGGLAKAAIIAGLLCGLFLFTEFGAWLSFYTAWKIAGRAYIYPEFIENFDLLGRKPRFAAVTRYEPYFIFGFTPNFPYGRQGSLVATDRHGLIVNNLAETGRDLRQKSGRYRIFLLGGSTLFGPSYDTSLGAYLERSLNNKCGPAFEVVTAGQKGFQSGQELARWAIQLVHLHPDMVITFDGVNDSFQSAVVKEFKPNSHYRIQTTRRLVDAGAEPAIVNLSPQAVFPFLRRFYTYQALLTVAAKLRISVPDTDTTEADWIYEDVLAMDKAHFRPEGAEVYLSNVSAITAIARDHGVKSMHFLQPTLATELMARGDKATSKDWGLMGVPDFSRYGLTKERRAEVTREFFDYVAPRFTEHAQLNGQGQEYWADLTRLFADVPDLTTVYYDYVHSPEAGLSRIAEAIAAHVMRMAGETACPSPVR